MATPVSLEEENSLIENNEFNLQKSYNKILYRGVTIQEYLPLYNQFINNFNDYIVEIKNDQRYIYKPEFLSQDLYNTTQFWQLLLIINNCKDRSDFNKDAIKVIRIESIDLVRSIMVNAIKKRKKENTSIVTDLTIRNIRV